MLEQVKTSEVLPQQVPQAVCAIDWLEYRGCGYWEGDAAAEWVERLSGAKRLAAELKKEEPLEIAGHWVMVQGSGMGRGRQSHMEFLLSWGNVMFAVAERDSDSMRNGNLYVKIPGEACLLKGEKACREGINDMLREVGFHVTSQSPSRIDLCLDVMNMALQDTILPACERGQMKGMMMKSADTLALHGEPRNGLSIGSRNAVRINLYDKLKESLGRGGEYLEAMRTHRWGGSIPSQAFRLEYQIGKEWLRRWQVNRLDFLIALLPAIIQKLTDYECHPLWVVTDSVPDRQNKNQSRANVLPEWQWAVDEFNQKIGTPSLPLEATERGEVTVKAAYQFVRGYLTSAAAAMRLPCERFEDSFEVLSELHRRNEGTDEDWKTRWLQKARKNGAFEEMISFPFGKGTSPDSTN